MKLKYLQAILLCLWSMNISAQKVSNITSNDKQLSKDTIPLQVLDNSLYRVFYSLSFVKDTTQVELKTEGQSLLMIGSKYSAFLDYNNLRKDSLYNALAQQEGINSMTVISKTISIGRQIKFKPIVIKNYPQKGECTFQEMITSKDYYQYVDKNIKLDWALSSEEKELQGYVCKKATCSYRGRDYTAWYCPDIPINDGPYVFNGLPGLILEIYDNQEHYKFSMNGFSKAPAQDPIYLHAKNIVHSSRKDVRKIISNLKANPVSMAQMISSNVKVSDEVLQKLQPKPYNPIELE